ncbi:MAG: acyl-ACP--UDP-N-acetylglucosamine O-acyltransferase [candidate division Zixibacteria bacterium]|nr:acyl-ACP--UDP-N-acetylglucosamine O-acyltransferase [candidate division Zixibacteria bacterium]
MSNSRIHESAIVSSRAELGAGVTVGPYAVVEDDVVIGDGSSVGSHALIAAGARIGKEVHIHHGAVVGTVPQDLKFGGEKTLLVIGDHTVIREYATLNRGTLHRGQTTVGAHCLLMAYSHVAHDCILGDHVIMSNSVNLAGHVEIEEWAIIGGMVPVHQFVRIGRHAMVGGGFRVPQDICPYSLYGGKVIGVNHVGLKRREFSAEAIAALEHAFRILFRSKLNTTQAVERVRAEVELTAEVQHVLDFIASSERGICK